MRTDNIVLQKKHCIQG